MRSGANFDTVQALTDEMIQGIGEVRSFKKTSAYWSNVDIKYVDSDNQGAK